MSRKFLEILVVFFLLVMSGCGSIPRDPEHTTEQVQDKHLVRVGYVAGEELDMRERMSELAELIALTHSAKIESHEGATDALMHALEAGELDIVIGVWSKDTPWEKRAALTKPFPMQQVKKDEPVVRGAVKQGENKWLLSIEKAIKEKSA